MNPISTHEPDVATHESAPGRATPGRRRRVWRAARSARRRCRALAFMPFLQHGDDAVGGLRNGSLADFKQVFVPFMQVGVPSGGGITVATGLRTIAL